MQQAAGVDGLILPDLPMFEFEKEYGAIIRKYKLDFVFLVTPETEETRIRKLDQLQHGFSLCCFIFFHHGEKCNTGRPGKIF